MSAVPRLVPPRPAGLRVLHVVRPAQGGIRQHVLSLLAQTDRSRFTPSLAAPPEFLGTIPRAAVAGTFPLPITPRFSPLEDLNAAFRLCVLSRHADVIHAHGLRAGWVAALAHLCLPRPFVVTAHNLVDSGGWPIRTGLRLIGRRASQIIAVSEAVAGGLTDFGVPPSKIRVIPNGIDLDHFAAMPDRGYSRRALSAPADGFVVGCIARLSPEKGLDVLLRAAALLPGLMFLIAGDGPERARLAANAPPNVRLLGRVTDTRVLLSAADVLAIPSRQEGQGIVALEAMAADVALVATRVGGLAEMLTDEETALLVPPDDAEALAAAVGRLAGDSALRRRLTDNARLMVRQKYVLAQMVRAVEAVYEEVA